MLEPIPAADAKSIEVLSCEYYGFPENTHTGIVCGQCTTSARDDMDDYTVQVHHVSVEHVRFCYGQREAMDAEVAGEIWAEKRNEQWFEERGGYDHEEQMASCYPQGHYAY
jgi:hypothetical protein